MEPKTVAALAVVLVAAVCFAAYHFWAGRPETVAVPRVAAAAPAVGVPRPVPSPGPPVGAGARTGAGVVVDVAGKVRRPGVRKLPAGARVADAVKAAGGALPGADTSGLNLARVLADGEQVVVGAPAPAPGPSGSAPGPTAPVSLSTATPEQLETLPGVGPVLAQHIIDYRTQHGGFTSIDQLNEVTGIGDRRFADLKPLVTP
jgi:competence protein ComEA